MASKIKRTLINSVEIAVLVAALSSGGCLMDGENTATVKSNPPPGTINTPNGGKNPGKMGTTNPIKSVDKSGRPL